MSIATKPARRLVSPIFLPPRAFIEATTMLQPREVGALALVATAWWPEGQLPEGTELGTCLGIRRSRAEALMPVLRPFFDQGGFFAVLRAAALAKSSRRARAGRKGAAALRQNMERAERLIPPRRT